MEMLTKEMVGDEDITKAEEPKYDYSDENLVNLPSRVLERYLAKKYGTDRYVRERSSVFEEASQNKISDRESILTGPELEALSLIFEEQIKQMKAKAKGGMAEQMEMFQEGGLKDEGGTVDPISGNEVPVGSTQEEVRDDIPAQLSEGEFVFPADVVRYLGLEFLMKLRQRAKAGLKKMEEMGQMGNADEATLPDDIPFTIDDLDIREETEEDMEMYQGGAVKAQAGMYVAPSIAPVRAGVATSTQPFIPQPAVTQTNMAFQQPPVMGVNPNLNFANFLGPSASGAPETEIRKYVHPDGRVRNITVVKATGLSLIPGELDKAKADGFIFEPEPLKDEVKVQPIKQQTSRVQAVDSSSDDGMPETTAVDGTGITLNRGLIQNEKLTKFLDTVTPLQQFGSTFKGPAYALFESKVLGVSPRTDSILSGAIGGVLDNFRGGNVTISNEGFLRGEYSNVTPLHELTTEQKDRLGEIGTSVIQVVQPLVREYNTKTKKYENTLTLEEQINRINKKAEELKIPTEFRQEGTNIINPRRPETIMREIAKKVAEQEQKKKTDRIYAATQAKLAREDDDVVDTGFIATPKGPTDYFSSRPTGGFFTDDDSDDSDQSTGGGDYSGPGGSDPEGVMGGEDVAKGSFVTKRKASGKLKKKYMKRGGLASKK